METWMQEKRVKKGKVIFQKRAKKECGWYRYIHWCVSAETGRRHVQLFSSTLIRRQDWLAFVSIRGYPDIVFDYYVGRFAPFSAEKYIWLVWTNTVGHI